MKFTSRFLMAILVITAYNTQPLMAQTTANFNFSLTSKPTTGWINVHGEPSSAVIMANDPVSGISISSVSTSNWSSSSGVCAADGVGANGSYFPSQVMNNEWAQYNYSTSVYNAVKPQLKISGLNKDSVYYVRMTSSFIYASWICDPTQYTVSGKTVAPSQLLNTHNNTTMGVTFQHIAPDSTGAIYVFVNTSTGTTMADISGIQILSGTSTVGIPAIAITNPANMDILPEESNIVITATASETGSTISKVEFYAGAVKIGEADAAPYTMTWMNPNQGNYLITAKATDAVGTTNIATINMGVESLTSFWSMTGNIRANADSNFLGTVDTNRLALRTNNVERVSILGDGTVGIGTKITDGYKLAVNGNAIFTKITVKAFNTWPDYVFKKEYKLPGLDSLERYIHLHQHLPGIVSQSVAHHDGIDLGDQQAALLKKVEELTLYLIEENKKLDLQSSLLENQTKRLEEQQQQIMDLKKIIQGRK